MSNRKRSRPLAQFEHGTRIYSPTADTPTYRVVALDRRTGQRHFFKLRTELEARAKARAIDDMLGAHGSVRGADDDRTVGHLAERWMDDHVAGLSRNYRNSQQRLLRTWVLPRLDSIHVLAWTPADSEAVLNAVRLAGKSDALRQDVGGTMRALVTHARRMRWLTSRDEDPMWMVRYTPKGGIQSQSMHYIPRGNLPTDEECNALFAAMADLGEPRWALAMRLKHRSGLRWSELTALHAGDLEFDPARVVHVRRAAEPGETGGRVLKAPKNGRIRTSIFPKSMTDELRELRDDVRSIGGAEGLLFPSRTGRLMARGSFQSLWARSAELAGWQMKRPTTRTTAKSKDQGWRWKGAAVWTPHDLRHVAACWMLFDLRLDPAVVAAKLGHADPSFTVKRFVGVRGDADLQAMAATEAW